MCERFRKCILHNGYATVVGSGKIGASWFPSIHFYDKDGNFFFWLDPINTQLLYKELRITFETRENFDDRDFLAFEWKTVKYKFVVRAGFVYITQYNLVNPGTEIFIDRPVAEYLLRAIEEVA